MDRACPSGIFRPPARTGRKRQVEMLGGGFYEPILISIPPHDRLEQLKCLADYVEKHFGERPRGAWLTERVWEPQFPSSLAAARRRIHARRRQPFPLRRIPARTALRPLHSPRIWATPSSFSRDSNHFAISSLLRRRRKHPFPLGASRAHPGGIAAMGDDLEKFGSWPGTHAHCYQNGWLENFFAALENCHDWLDVSTPADAIDRILRSAAPICPPLPTRK